MMQADASRDTHTHTHTHTLCYGVFTPRNPKRKHVLVIGGGVTTGPVTVLESFLKSLGDMSHGDDVPEVTQLVLFLFLFSTHKHTHTQYTHKHTHTHTHNRWC